MANNQSWEFYLQPGSSPYPLNLVAGQCTSAPFESMTLMPNSLYAVAFDAMRNFTVSSLSVNLFTQDRNVGAGILLGLYANSGSTAMFPTTLVGGASSTMAIDMSASSIVTVSVSLNLTDANRWWAVLMTNGNVSNAQIAAVADAAVLPFGTFINPVGGQGNSFAPARLLAVPNQSTFSLPSTFPSVNVYNLILGSDSQVPAISLGLSAVT